MRFPRTLQEFQTRFSDEEACWEALREARWPQGFVCPGCHGRRIATAEQLVHRIVLDARRIVGVDVATGDPEGPLAQ